MAPTIPVARRAAEDVPSRPATHRSGGGEHRRAVIADGTMSPASTSQHVTRVAGGATWPAPARPFEFDAHRRRPLQPDLPRRRRRRHPLRAAPPAARPRARQRPRHGPRAPHHLRAARTRRCPWRRRSATAPTGRQRRAVLRHGLRRRPRAPRPRRRRGRRSTWPARRPRRRVARRHAGRHPRRRPRSRRPRRPGPARRLHRPPAQAVVRPVERSRRPASCPLVDEVHDVLVGRIPEQGPATHRPRRLPPRQLHRRRRRPVHRAVLDWEICTLGDPLADVGLLQVYWTGPGDDADGLGRLVDDRRRASRTGTRLAERYAAVSGRDLSRARLLRGVRLLEAGLHPGGRLRPLPRRRPRRPRPRPSWTPFKQQVDGAAVQAAEHAGASGERRDMTDHHFVRGAAGARGPGAGGDAHRVDRRQRGGARRPATLVEECCGHARSSPSTTTPTSTSAPAVR